MLSILSGREHHVITATILMKADGSKVSEQISDTIVSFRTLDQNLIQGYLRTDEPNDKAGAYAIQGTGAMLVKSISGSYTNVVGLPLAEVTELLEEHGVWQPFSKSNISSPKTQCRAGGQA